MKEYFVGQGNRIPRYQSILITRSEDGLGENLDIDSALSTWDASSNMVFLVPHFPLDVIEALKAVSVGSHSVLGCARTQWIDGSEILILDSARQQSTIALSGSVGPKGWLLHGMLSELDLDEPHFRDAFGRIADLPPTCFLLDFSNLSLDKVFGEISPQGTNVGPDWTCRAIRDFSSWITKRGLPHRLLIAMPRFFLAAQPFHDLVEQSRTTKSAFYAAQLFSDKYEFRVGYFEEIVQRTVPEYLRSLLSANSNALIHDIAAFLLSRQDQHCDKRDARQTLEAKDLLALSADLALSGFYEIALRLELLCSTLTLRKLRPERDVHSLVSLDLDLARHDAHNRQEYALVGGVERIPHALTLEQPKIGGSKLWLL